MSKEATSREAICALGAKLAARGLCPGTSGNISVRVDDGWLMTPTNSSLGELDPARLSRLDAAGKHVAGDPPTKEALLHRSVYDVRPKDGAIVHLHSTHAVAISCLDPSCHHNAETTLPPLTAYFVMRVGKLPLVPYFKPGDPKLADAIREYAKGHRAVLLANHGPVVAGTSLSAASASIEELEETAKLHLLMQGLKVRLLTAAQVREVEEAFPS
jgi:ribulose-5-phosphate 4-epimerase/fuculose-1-phosphate aldolase